MRHELHCTPVQNEETLQILSLRALEAQQPKKQIRVMSNLPPNGISSEKQFEGFIVRYPLRWCTIFFTDAVAENNRET